MNQLVFSQVVERFNNGEVLFNRGENWSFLYAQKWYPIHAFMAEYNLITGVNREMNLHSAVFELSKLLPITTTEVRYSSCLPLAIF
jgi:hypothetical protein